MRITALLAALFLLASPLAARAAAPTASCPDVLVGDSLAVGMGPYARAAGFEVVARVGIGLNWLRAQSPRCARRVVVVIGTNDLRGLDPWSAEAYPDRLAAIMGRWQTQEITWATPGCFPYDESLERGSEALSQVLAREPLVRVGGGRGYMRVHSGRPARCNYLSGDGIHPTGTGYRAWWANLSQVIGPTPDDSPSYDEARPYREAQPYREARLARVRHGHPASRNARLAGTSRQARGATPPHSARVARADRRGASTRVAQAAPPARPGRAQPQAAPPPSARMARTAPAAQTRLARTAPAPRQEQRLRVPQQPARTAATARTPARDQGHLRLPPASRQASANPLRRT